MNTYLNLKGLAMPEAANYEIRVRDVLDEKWKAYFSPFTLTLEAEETVLTGVAHDQAELFGVLLKIRDLGLRLVSVKPISL
jgi:phosphopantothenoylcysteine synthetase/decarboxylase